MKPLRTTLYSITGNTGEIPGSILLKSTFNNNLTFRISFETYEEKHAASKVKVQLKLI